MTGEPEPLLVRVMRRNVMAYRALYAAVEGDMGPAERLVALDALADHSDLVTLHTGALPAEAVGPSQVVFNAAPQFNRFIARIWIERPERWRVLSIVIGTQIVFGDGQPPGVPAAELDSVLPPLFLPARHHASIQLVSSGPTEEPSVIHVLGTGPF